MTTVFVLLGVAVVVGRGMREVLFGHDLPAGPAAPEERRKAA